MISLRLLWDTLSLQSGYILFIINGKFDTFMSYLQYYIYYYLWYKDFVLFIEKIFILILLLMLHPLPEFNFYILHSHQHSIFPLTFSPFSTRLTRLTFSPLSIRLLVYCNCLISKLIKLMGSAVS